MQVVLIIIKLEISEKVNLKFLLDMSFTQVIKHI